MASQDEIETRKAILRARGVPEAFIDNLANRRDMALGRIFLPTLLLVIFFCVLTLATWLSDDIVAIAVPYIYGGSTKSLLFYAPSTASDWGSQLCFFLGIVMFAVGSFVGALRLTQVRPFPNYDFYARYLRKLAPGETLAAILPSASFHELANLSDDAAFLKALRASKVSFKTSLFSLAIVSIPLIGIGLSAVSGSNDYKSVTLDFIKINDDSGTHIYRLSDAKYAYVVCYDTEDSVRFRYRIVYPEVTINLWERRDILHGLGTEGVIDRLDLIDKKLTSLGIPIHRMPSTGSPRDDGMACVKDAAEYWDLQKPETLRRLVFGQ